MVVEIPKREGSFVEGFNRSKIWWILGRMVLERGEWITQGGALETHKRMDNLLSMHSLCIWGWFRNKILAWIMVWWSNLKGSWPSDLRYCTEIGEASIADLMDLSSGFAQWNAIFLKAAQDWEIDTFTDFFNLLYTCRVNGGELTRSFGIHPRRGDSLFIRSTRPLWCKIQIHSHGRIYGRLRPP